jgi:two-component system cell cycle response regulator DivK
MSLKVLVAEDNKDSNNLMCYLLRAFGHTVYSARDGGQAVELAAREQPDVIVMDLQMERMGGLEAAGLMAADPLLAAIPRVAVTAYAMTGDRDRTLAAGFDGYLTKPIDPETFVGLIEAYQPGRPQARGGRG